MWFFKNKMCTSKVRLNSKTAVITGANNGIGKETARDFYGRGARVILACRNMEKAQKAVEDIKNNPPLGINKFEYQNHAGELAIYFLDLCSLRSVRECANNLLRNEESIHILVNNAGVSLVPKEKTEDGHDVVLQTNHFSHFLLTLLLLPKMRSSSPDCRIINVSSIVHWIGDIHFDDISLENSRVKVIRSWKAYAQSKLANILFTKELARRLKEKNIDGINVYSLHPGLIPTDLFRQSNRAFCPGWELLYKLFTSIFCKNIVQGAQTTIYCAVDEKIANETGLYYSNCDIATPTRRARNDQYARKLWDLSCQLLQLKPEEDLTASFSNVLEY